jgi:hypothetical protein
MMDGVTTSLIDLNHTPVPMESSQPARRCPRGGPPASTIHARVLFDEMTAPTLADSVWSILLVMHSFSLYEGGITPN